MMDWAQAGTAAQTELAPCMPGTGWPPFTPGAGDAKTRGMPTRGLHVSRGQASWGGT